MAKIDDMKDKIQACTAQTKQKEDLVKQLVGVVIAHNSILLFENMVANTSRISQE